MTADPLVWLRWLQFVDLGLVFGLPFTARLLGERNASGRARWVLAVTAVLGLVIGVAGFLVTLAHMAGTGLGDLDRSLVVMMLTGSALGWSFTVRLMALLLILIVLVTGARPRLALLVGPGAVAATSLAWAGHAAASQGVGGLVRLAGDVIHLWAALSWLGALFLFCARLWSMPAGNRSRLPVLLRQLVGFALVGSILVGLLVASGIANLLYLAAPTQWPVILASAYGRLIVIKLSLFALMFLLAAHNRFHLVPRLDTALGQATNAFETRRKALAALRRSITLETVLALGVVWCVAFAGTLDPLGAS